MNPILSATGGARPNMMQMVQQIKQNPMQMLMQTRFKLPQGIQTNDPNAILDYLVRSGQVSQNQINGAYQTAQQMGIQPSGAQMDVNTPNERK